MLADAAANSWLSAVLSMLQHAHVQTFFWGCLGGLAVELAAIHRVYRRGGRFPQRYTTRGFWIVRTMLMAVSGAFAVGYDIKTAIIAIHIGVATPVIIEQLAHATPPITGAGD